MRIGIIGLGDIAEKAYLPILTAHEKIELVLCTRNGETLRHFAEKYRIKEAVRSVEELIAKDVEAVFVSAATVAHYPLAKKLLEAGISIYVDKPLSLHFEESEELVQLAKEKGVTAMVGFNRRFVPRIAELKEAGKPDLVLIQKNRYQLPDHARRFIVEDFIHVVDTLRFLMDTPVTDISVQFKEREGILLNVVIELSGEGVTAIGIMNRNNAVTEEIVEYMTPEKKFRVEGLYETTVFQNKDTNKITAGDWEPTLAKRGFYDLIDHFLDAVEKKTDTNPSFADSLETHRVCEEIVKKIEGKN
ncbi:Gfo/Idh/MocA family protein [Lacticigenium naphthae]|uniref:Gfo/Idh/MocA family protein n=1 Tax=Lacticigenium naphthae TaxID=515351 RepID=UPI0003FDD30B|nr:Gfo/Idh/MocA family oxidoreductase [Lacticigenium naphthae]